MYTIISGTNRVGSNTLKVATLYQQLLQKRGIAANLLSLTQVNFLVRDAAFEKIENELLIPTNKFLFITPEYNGSFPGALKMLIDTSKSNIIWANKRALLTGVSTGRAGNLRGMEHLAGVLHYLKITVLPNLLPISVINTLMDENGQLTDENTLKVINQQLDQFINWA